MGLFLSYTARTSSALASWSCRDPEKLLTERTDKAVLKGQAKSSRKSKKVPYDEAPLDSVWPRKVDGPSDHVGCEQTGTAPLIALCEADSNALAADHFRAGPPCLESAFEPGKVCYKARKPCFGKYFNGRCFD